jgi:hypothetical protein
LSILNFANAEERHYKSEQIYFVIMDFDPSRDCFEKKNPVLRRMAFSEAESKELPW